MHKLSWFRNGWRCFFERKSRDSGQRVIFVQARWRVIMILVVVNILSAPVVWINLPKSRISKISFAKVSSCCILVRPSVVRSLLIVLIQYSRNVIRAWLVLTMHLLTIKIDGSIVVIDYTERIISHTNYVNCNFNENYLEHYSFQLNSVKMIIYVLHLIWDYGIDVAFTWWKPMI